MKNAFENNETSPAHQSWIGFAPIPAAMKVWNEQRFRRALISPADGMGVIGGNQWADCPALACLLPGIGCNGS